MKQHKPGYKKIPYQSYAANDVAFTENGKLHFGHEDLAKIFTRNGGNNFEFSEGLYRTKSVSGDPKIPNRQYANNVNVKIQRERNFTTHGLQVEDTAYDFRPQTNLGNNGDFILEQPQPISDALQFTEVLSNFDDPYTIPPSLMMEIGCHDIIFENLELLEHPISKLTPSRFGTHRSEGLMTRLGQFKFAVVQLFNFNPFVYNDPYTIVNKYTIQDYELYIRNYIRYYEKAMGVPVYPTMYHRVIAPIEGQLAYDKQLVSDEILGSVVDQLEQIVQEGRFSRLDALLTLSLLPNLFHNSRVYDRMAALMHTLCEYAKHPPVTHEIPSLVKNVPVTITQGVGHDYTMNADGSKSLNPNFMKRYGVKIPLSLLLGEKYLKNQLGVSPYIGVGEIGDAEYVYVKEEEKKEEDEKKIDVAKAIALPVIEEVKEELRDVEMEVDAIEPKMMPPALPKKKKEEVKEVEDEEEEEDEEEVEEEEEEKEEEVKEEKKEKLKIDKARAILPPKNNDGEVKSMEVDEEKIFTPVFAPPAVPKKPPSLTKALLQADNLQGTPLVQTAKDIAKSIALPEDVCYVPVNQRSSKYKFIANLYHEMGLPPPPFQSKDKSVLFDVCDYMLLVVYCEENGINLEEAVDAYMERLKNVGTDKAMRLFTMVRDLLGAGENMVEKYFRMVDGIPVLDESIHLVGGEASKEILKEAQTNIIEKAVTSIVKKPDGNMTTITHAVGDKMRAIYIPQDEVKYPQTQTGVLKLIDAFGESTENIETIKAKLTKLQQKYNKKSQLYQLVNTKFEQLEAKFESQQNKARMQFEALNQQIESLNEEKNKLNQELEESINSKNSISKELLDAMQKNADHVAFVQLLQERMKEMHINLESFKENVGDGYFYRVIVNTLDYFTQDIRQASVNFSISDLLQQVAVYEGSIKSLQKLEEEYTQYQEDVRQQQQVIEVLKDKLQNTASYIAELEKKNSITESKYTAVVQEANAELQRLQNDLKGKELEKESLVVALNAASSAKQILIDQFMPNFSMPAAGQDDDNLENVLENNPVQLSIESGAPEGSSSAIEPYNPPSSGPIVLSNATPISSPKKGESRALKSFDVRSERLERLSPDKRQRVKRGAETRQRRLQLLNVLPNIFPESDLQENFIVDNMLDEEEKEAYASSVDSDWEETFVTNTMSNQLEVYQDLNHLSYAKSDPDNESLAGLNGFLSEFEDELE